MTDDDILDIISDVQKGRAVANPLDGPATMFEAIARRLRAGEDYQAVLEDYGVRIDEPPLAARIEAVCATLHVGLGIQARDLVELQRRVRSVLGGG